MINLVKAIEVNGNGFWYLHNRLSSEKSDAKQKAGVFIGPKVCRLIEELDF